jgi:hypothetical protein
MKVIQVLICLGVAWVAAILTGAYWQYAIEQIFLDTWSNYSIWANLIGCTFAIGLAGIITILGWIMIVGYLVEGLTEKENLVTKEA